MTTLTVRYAQLTLKAIGPKPMEYLKVAPSSTPDCIRIIADPSTVPHWRGWERQILATAIRQGQNVSRVEIVSGLSNRVVRIGGA